jgi:hypothetical protein
VRDFWMPGSAKDTPGPGDYTLPNDNGLPKWTIGYRSISRSDGGSRRSISSLSRTSGTSEQS